MRVTAKDATLLTMRIATIDLILRSRRRRHLEGEVVHSATPALHGAYARHRSLAAQRRGVERRNGGT